MLSGGANILNQEIVSQKIDHSNNQSKTSLPPHFFTNVTLLTFNVNVS